MTDPFPSSPEPPACCTASTPPPRAPRPGSARWRSPPTIWRTPAPRASSAPSPSPASTPRTRRTPVNADARPGVGPFTGPFDLHRGRANHTGGHSLAATALDLSQGPLEETGGSLDAALAGPGFFQVTENGAARLTRDGRFARGSDGTLVTADRGLPVLGEGGRPIELPADAEAIRITHDGTVSAVYPGGTAAALGRLSVVQPTDPAQLVRTGDGLLKTDGPTRPADPSRTSVRQGYVEGSGVNPVAETTALIAASRGFETNLNLVKLQDESLGQLLSAARP